MTLSAGNIMDQQRRSIAQVVFGLIFLADVLFSRNPAVAAPVKPPVWEILADDFESATLDQWLVSGVDNPFLIPGAGYAGSTGLAVNIDADSHYIYQTDLAKSEETYLSFWFNPNGVFLPEPTPNYWPPGTSLSIAEVVNSENWWPPLVALYVRRPVAGSYQAYLAWPIDEAGNRFYDYDHTFPLVDGWQQLTVGFRVDAWVAVWLNGELMRYYDQNVVHPDPYGDITFFGKVRNTSSDPSGMILFDEVAFQVPSVMDLWVDTSVGSDANDGLSVTAPFKTIQKAADLAGPGTTVHILPGVYRETVWPALNGNLNAPVVFKAEDGPGSVNLRGSENSSSLSWTQLTYNSIGLPSGVDPGNIYFTDLSGWELDYPPRFVFGNERLPMAREPDWMVLTEWKTHELWWAADGGSSPAACNPEADIDPHCDYATRSLTQLTDRTDDASPAGIEPGNLTTLGDLTEATLVAIDTVQGHYVYRRKVIDHDLNAGRITVDQICEHDGGSGNPGLGWGSKYYLEGLPGFLDSPGEWWYDRSNQRLYLWPVSPGDPAGQNLEISRRDFGFILRNRSYIVLDGLTIEFQNHSSIYQHNWTEHRSYGNYLLNLTIRYANYGVYIEQDVAATESAGNLIDGFALEDSEVAFIDSQGIRLIDWWDDGANPEAFTHSGIRNTLIRGNEFHHLGFRTDGDNAIGLSFTFANEIRFEDNHVHHIAHNGVQFSESVIQSPKEYGFDPGEIKTGGILIQGNLIEKTCQLTTDCGGLKFWGYPPDNHVFRDVLVTGNIFRNTFGWTYISEKRRRWMGGEGSLVRGLGGFGLYVDHASGIHAYRNISYNNAFTDYMVYGRWRDGALVYVNNIAANSLYGMSLGGGSYDTHDPVDTRVIDNLLINNEAFGMSLSYALGHYSNTEIDHNLYFSNGWRGEDQGGIWHAGAMVVSEGGSWDPYPTLEELQVATPWEDHGVSGDPALWQYDWSDHDLLDSSWPDFHLTSASANAIDKGVDELPASLTALLDLFNVQDFHSGLAFDIGRYEAGFGLSVTPSSQACQPGDSAVFNLSLYPAELPFAVTLAEPNIPEGFSVSLSSPSLSAGETVTLTVGTVSDTPAGWTSMVVTGVGGGFMASVGLNLLVGGARLHLPVFIHLR
jgi:hypothetical protein